MIINFLQDNLCILSAFKACNAAVLLSLSGKKFTKADAVNPQRSAESTVSKYTIHAFVI